MDCKEVGKILFLFLDNEMEEGLQTPFRDHTDGCRCCAQKVDYARRLLLIVRQRCIRCTASEALRLRILTSLPHRAEAKQL